jgi:transaldolase
MRFFIDTANMDQIRQAKAFGLVDGVTTNPSLLAKEGGDWRKVVETICREVEGPVSLEVVGTTAGEMIAEARELIKIGPNVVVKVPMTLEGLSAVRELKAMDIPTNVTLVFSPVQALLAAKAGAAYVSPFVGRLDDVSQDGMELVEQILTINQNYLFETEVIVASVRSPMHVLRAALLGADVATIPFSVIKGLAGHPLTDAGLAKFMADWKTLAP